TASMAYIHAVGEAQERRKFQSCQPILLRKGFEIIIVECWCLTAMVAHEVGDNVLFAFAQPNQMISFQQIISVPIVINSIDEMTDIVQKRASFQQQEVAFVKIVQGD